MSQTADTDDVEVFTKFVENIGNLSDSMDDIAAQLHATSSDMTIHIRYDDRIARALESIADTLARLERA